MKLRLVLIGLAGAQVACMTGPKAVSGPPADYLEVNNPPVVWAVLKDGQQIVVEGPRVIADTVFGWIEGEEVAIPADQFEEVRVRKLSVVRSAILPAIATAGAVTAFVAISSSQEGHEINPIDDPGIMNPDDDEDLGRSAARP